MTQNGREVSWQTQAIIAGVILISAPVLLGVGGWFADRLSPDALGMGVGLLFGVLAGLPTTLLLLRANELGRQAAEPEGWPDEYTEPAPQLTINETHYHYHAPAALPEGEQSIVVVMQPKQLTGGRYE